MNFILKNVCDGAVIPFLVRFEKSEVWIYFKSNVSGEDLEKCIQQEHFPEMDVFFDATAYWNVAEKKYYAICFDRDNNAENMKDVLPSCSKYYPESYPEWDVIEVSLIPPQKSKAEYGRMSDIYSTFIFHHTEDGVVESVEIIDASLCFFYRQCEKCGMDRDSNSCQGCLDKTVEIEQMLDC